MTDKLIDASEFPDPESQFLCRGCRKWLPKQQISARLVSGGSRFAFDLTVVVDFARAISGYRESADRYLCHGCHRRRRIRNYVVWTLLLAALVVVLVVEAIQ